MSTIELSTIKNMTMKERVGRCIELFNWSRDFIGRQIQMENPDFSDAKIRLLVAKRIYSNEPQIIKLIEKQLDDVSD